MSKSGRRTLKAIHLASTLWFVLCIAYILVLALHQAGFQWWVIFSLSGHTAVIIFLLIAVYLFAVFRGAGRAEGIEIEHPLTSTNYYLAFYAAAPLLGGLAGCLATIGENKATQFLVGVALGTFATTALVWVVVDPLISAIEPLVMPPSRKHRAERLAQTKAEHKRKQQERQRLLADILEKQERDQHYWQQFLRPQAEKLAELLAADVDEFRKAECQAVDIGLSAWQLGGIACMRQLRDMAVEISRQKNQKAPVTDYISFWWDGIGTWRSPSLA